MFGVFCSVVTLIYFKDILYPQLPTAERSVYYCQEFTRQKLKAPSTSKFLGVGSGLKLDTIQDGPDEYVFRVRGFFDSQNTYGAMLRGKYDCLVSTKLGSETWTLDSITIN